MVVNGEHFTFHINNWELQGFPIYSLTQMNEYLFGIKSGYTFNKYNAAKSENTNQRSNKYSSRGIKSIVCQALSLLLQKYGTTRLAWINVST